MTANYHNEWYKPGQQSLFGPKAGLLQSSDCLTTCDFFASFSMQYCIQEGCMGRGFHKKATISFQCTQQVCVKRAAKSVLGNEPA